MSPADSQRAMLANQLLPRPRNLTLTGGELVLNGRAFALQLQGAWTAGAHQQLVELLRHFEVDANEGRAQEGGAEKDGAEKDGAEKDGAEKGSARAEIPLRVFCGEVAGDAPFSVAFAEAATQRNESYELRITREKIVLSAPTSVGVARGAQTLIQLLALQLPALPCLHIEDEPALAFRGLLIDVARHFIELPVLLRTLDGMAHHKMNVLHLHLTDDQAFRFPSAAYPALNQFGPAYTLDELHSLVAHASNLGIRVVPELDMPGHTTCWLAAYPEWSLFPVTATDRFGVHQACLNPADDKTFEVIGTLLDEFAAVFVDECVHVGGDEVHPRWWQEHADVQAFMHTQEFAAPRDLQAYFTTRVSEMLRLRGKRMLVWDEAVHQALPDTTVVQAWRGMTARDVALAAGHQCIVSAPYYLDLFYPADLHTNFAPQEELARAIAAEDAMLRDVRLSHVAGGLEWTKQWRERALDYPEQRSAGLVLGAEACLWSELVDGDLLDIRLWSRLPLLAELFWCGELDEAQQDYTRITHSLASWQCCGGPELAAGFASGVSSEQLDLLAPLAVNGEVAELLAVLEPSKWYSRLLGAAALEARLQGSEMPQARPYNLGSSLRGIADVISPQSYRVAQFSELLARWQAAPLSAADSALLQGWVNQWQSQAVVVAQLSLAPKLAVELLELALRLEDFAQLVGGLADQHQTAALSATALVNLPQAQLVDWLTPVGELMLAVIAPLLRLAQEQPQKEWRGRAELGT